MQNKGPPPSLSEANFVEGLIWRTMSDSATSRCDKNVFFSVNRQAVACWRPMPSN